MQHLVLLIYFFQESSVKEFEHVAKMNAELKMKINAIKSVRSEQEPEIIRVSYCIREDFIKK